MFDLCLTYQPTSPYSDVQDGREMVAEMEDKRIDNNIKTHNTL